MKKIVLSIFIITALASCSSSKDSTKKATEEVPEETKTAPKRVNNNPVR